VTTPGAKVSAGELFRCLSSFERPSVQIVAPAFLGETVAASVVAISSIERARLADAGNRSAFSFAVRLVAETLRIDGMRESLTDIARMPSQMFDELHSAVCDGLEVCSPWYDIVDHSAWIAKLCDGAKEDVNVLHAFMMGKSQSAQSFFGRSDLTDGQFLAYVAAAKVHGKHD